METSALFPDHKILARILMEDINLPYDEWKEKVDKPIKPILNKINKSVQYLVPSLQNFRPYERSRKEAIQGRLRNSRIRWKYENPNLSLDKDIDIFVQLGDYHEDNKGTIFWGIGWWGSSKASEQVYQFFKKVNNGGDVIREDGGPGASGTTILRVKKKYTADQLLNLKSDIKKEIAEDIKYLVQKMDGISKENEKQKKIESSDAEIPTWDEIQAIYRKNAKPGEIIAPDRLKELIKNSFQEQGRKLPPNWWEETKKILRNESEKQRHPDKTMQGKTILRKRE